MSEKRTSYFLVKKGLTRAEFAKLMHEFRINAGFSYQQMASYIGGVAWSTIYRWEKGHTVPNTALVFHRLIDCKIL